MNRSAAEKRLAALGYEIDWSVSGPNPEGGWSGTIDAIGRGQIDGDCRGEVVFGDNASDWYKNAIAAAKGYYPPEQCTDPNCDFHSDHEIVNK